jgi:uncharacterized phage protein gp47/JayE
VSNRSEISGNQSHKPKPNVGTGQQKVDTAVESKITSIENVPVPESAHIQAYKTVEPDLREINAALTKELEDAKKRLLVIKSVINNPFHQVGYLVNCSPIKRALTAPIAELEN